jgi:hypothetical protein
VQTSQNNHLLKTTSYQHGPGDRRRDPQTAALSSTQPHLCHLPDESLSEIAAHLQPICQFRPSPPISRSPDRIEPEPRLVENKLRKASLLSLCQTSRRFGCVTKPHLYAYLILDPNNPASEASFDRLLVTTCYLTIITIIIYIPE